MLDFSKIEGVIFDLDGVIADSEGLHMEVEKELFGKKGINLIPKDFDRYRGTTVEFMFAELIEKHHLPDNLEDLIREKNRRLIRAYQERLKPLPGVIPLIQKIFARRLKLAVASSSRHELIDFVLKKFDLRKYFAVLVGAEDIKKSKPDPEIFLLAAQKLGINPKNCLVIEDSEKGLAAAKRAGMKCAALKSPYSREQVLKKADWVVENLKELSASF